jgi:hypothetical protein
MYVSAAFPFIGIGVLTGVDKSHLKINLDHEQLTLEAHVAQTQAGGQRFESLV